MENQLKIVWEINFFLAKVKIGFFISKIYWEKFSDFWRYLYPTCTIEKLLSVVTHFLFVLYKSTKILFYKRTSCEYIYKNYWYHKLIKNSNFCVRFQQVFNKLTLPFGNYRVPPKKTQ
jgi:hypothetical protein